MHHICVKCTYCNFSQACVQCATDYFHLYEETLSSIGHQRLTAVRGDISLLDFPFEIESQSNSLLKVSHPYFNCSELNLVPLLLMTHAASLGTIKSDAAIQESIVKFITLLICRPQPTPRDLIHFIDQKEVNINIFDSRKSHLLDFEQMFKIFSKGEYFIADIHDLTHHGTQIQLWGEFVKKLGAFGYEAFRRDNLLNQELAVFLLYACLEYAIIGSEKNAFSSGCLNWQSPRKSPAEMIRSYELCGVCINRWNTFRAMVSLSRRQIESSTTLGQNLDWLEKLGYILPPAYLKLAEGTQNMHREQESKYHFKGPECLQDLFSNASNLMTEVSTKA